MKKRYLFIWLCLIIMLIRISPTAASGYEQYFADFAAVSTLAEAEAAGYEIAGTNHIITGFETAGFNGECTVYPMINRSFGRVALFFADGEGNVLYKTENLECNYFLADSLYQPNTDIIAISVRDINEDGLPDLLLLSRCLHDGKKFKIGDIVYQGQDTFYRDWRVSDNINRFSMNKDIEMMAAFAHDGQSTEFLYRATTLDELTDGGFVLLKDQIFNAEFEKFGTVRVIPGEYRMSVQYIFILYLVNSDGQIVWNFQGMRDYDNFGWMSGISFKDVDGDGWADLSILANYKSFDENNKTYDAIDFSIYYQRDGYFFEDQDFHEVFLPELTGTEVMDDIVQAARKYWGW